MVRLSEQLNIFVPYKTKVFGRARAFTHVCLHVHNHVYAYVHASICVQNIPGYTACAHSHHMHDQHNTGGLLKGLPQYHGASETLINCYTPKPQIGPVVAFLTAFKGVNRIGG